MSSIRERIDVAMDAVLGAYEGALVGRDTIHEMHNAAMTLERVQEGIIDPSAALQLTVEDIGWTALNEEFAKGSITRDTLRRCTQLSRLMYLLNPLIKRAVTVQELYVWGSGCTIKAESGSPEVQEVLDDFFLDPKNQTAIGDAWPEREREQRIDGNVFFIFFVNRSTGAARVRTLTIDEIEDKYFDPEDRADCWYYKRVLPDDKRVLYPDINYNPIVKPRSYKPANSEDTYSVNWDVRVLHVKTGGLPVMKFGMPETYSVLNWATAYKGILENFATILKAYSRIAMKLTGQKNADKVAAAKSKLGTGMSSGLLNDTNPPPNTASWAIMAGNADLSAVRTANYTTGPDEARALRSMVAAGTDTPEHFFGDSDIGNFATSSTLDRPTELKMIARQNMWASVIMVMVNKLQEWSAVAPRGILRESGFTVELTKDKFDGTRVVIITPPQNKSLKTSIKFPTILERNVTDRVRALVQAATLGGRPAEGIFKDRKLLFRLLLEALGEKEADYITEQTYPESVMQGFKDPADDVRNEKVEADAKKKLADAAMKAAEQPAAQPQQSQGGN